MKKGLTELVFILDRSGSMSGLEQDTIGGYNAMIKKQRGEVGEAMITTVLFDDNYELLHDRSNLKTIHPLTAEEYYVRGTTALLDAVGKTIQKVKKAHKDLTKTEKPEKVLFIITTDGQENASREYTYDKVKSLIEKQKREYDWEFIFLGANIDAVSEARKFGIDSSRAARFNNDSEGIHLNYEAVSNAISELRADSIISSKWKNSIEEDYKNRKL